MYEKHKTTIVIILSTIVFYIVLVGSIILIKNQHTSTNTPTFSLSIAEPTQTFSATGNPGCGVATVSPEPEPCIAVQGIILAGVFGNLVNSTQFKAWKRDNPGEYSRLSSYMKANTVPPAMLTFLGATLISVVQTYWYARAADPLVWPTPNPPLDPNRKDKTPPTQPTHIVVSE